MIYSSNIGKIYDVIFFFIEHYSQEAINNNYINYYADTRFMLDCYEQVKNRIMEIPEILSPLFFSSDGSRCAISDFFNEQIDTSDESIDSFILKLTTNTDIIYQKTLDSLFHNCVNTEFRKLIPMISPGSYIDAINKLDMPVEFKLQVSLLFGNFSYTVSILAGLMKKVYLLVEELHEKYKKEIKLEFEKIQSEKNIRLYSEVFKYNPSSADTTVITITLLNQYVIYGPVLIQKDIFLMLGYKHEEAIIAINDVELLSTDQFIISCGNEIRLNILHDIIKNGELTASQIARDMNCPVTTLIRHLDVLKNRGLIILSKQEGLQIFYKVNTALFKKMQVKINRIFNGINGRREG